MASNDTVCWDKSIPHTVIGKFWHTIAITEGGGKENDKHKHLGDRLQTLAHPMKTISQNMRFIVEIIYMEEELNWHKVKTCCVVRC